VCNGLPEVLRRYEEITPRVQLAGPTSFAPLIRYVQHHHARLEQLLYRRRRVDLTHDAALQTHREAINIVKRERAYHILVIIADGQGIVRPSSLVLGRSC
jgi:hypothetical protein